MSKQTDNELPFGKDNYMAMGIGVLTLVIGFILMSGGGSDNPEVYSEEIFSFRRLTLAPLMVLSGFGVVMYGILKKPKTEE